ncbi:hypothetical protein ARMSODRAFT_460566 [Armillaria solidipes]|uniref:Uncharacterized protein n=1 Tax=Armillaria solidipes TaxID=1076256 RepID=A0A2H3BJJ8_9AGAR|nr:hypothetical protein ARMSODRAFT_460566 [Armillaria solidipes]
MTPSTAVAPLPPRGSPLAFPRLMMLRLNSHRQQSKGHRRVRVPMLRRHSRIYSYVSRTNSCPNFTILTRTLPSGTDTHHRRFRRIFH